ncbi:MAG: SsrA-binding protein SmpB [Planctomycetes bacterium]|nr:SsrA-binding protein SmpB [Planctomycetota bacterium]
MGQQPKRSTAGAARSGAVLVVVENKRARHEFEVLDSFEAGLVLRGTEVKSLRDKQVSLDEAYGRIDDGEAFLVGARIEPYRHASIGNHEPTRRRKLLLRRMEIRKLTSKVQQKGLTLVPMRLYFDERGLAKVTLALCRGRQLHDKRAVLKKREAERDIARGW